MPILVEFSSLEENINLCNELNLDFIELNLDIPYCFPENMDSNLLNKNNFTIHISEKFDVGELNNSLREFYLSEIEKIVSFGTKIIFLNIIFILIQVFIFLYLIEKYLSIKNI